MPKILPAAVQVSVLALCDGRGFGVDAHGGGASVVGGVTPDREDRPVIALATEHLSGLLELDEAEGEIEAAFLLFLERGSSAGFGDPLAIALAVVVPRTVIVPWTSCPTTMFAPEYAGLFDAFVLYDMPGIEFHPEVGGARQYCEKLMTEGMLCKETHENTIRFAPPLVIEKADIDWAFERVKNVLENL